MADKPVFTTLDPPEKSRTYFYPNGDNPSVPYRVRFDNVTALCVCDSGSHRLNMSDGTKAIAPPGFIAIQIDTPEWTF